MNELPYTLVINDTFPSLNVTKRFHFGKMIQIKKSWCKKLHHQMTKNSYKVHKPYDKGILHIIRHSIKLLDYDNFVGGSKELVDLFLTPTLQQNGKVKNKYGLGFFIDDNPEVLEVKYFQVKINNMSDKKTVFHIGGYYNR